MPGLRKIIHLDMDCFYAAVEMRERPELAGQPIAVGGGRPRGVVTTCNYEARAYGVRSAMPGFKARELCPHLVFLPVRFDLYREASARVREILLSYTPLVEPLSLDEAYLDVTALGRYAWDIAKEIRARIFETTRLTGSAGIAPNRCSPRSPATGASPTASLPSPPIKSTPSCATSPCARSGASGRRAPNASPPPASTPAATCKKSPPRARPPPWQMGRGTVFPLRGQDDRDVVPNRIRKSLSNERTYAENLATLAACQNANGRALRRTHGRAPHQGLRAPGAQGLHQIKFHDFTRITAKASATAPTSKSSAAPHQGFESSPAPSAS